jgi:hypothetical protein
VASIIERIAATRRRVDAVNIVDETVPIIVYPVVGYLSGIRPDVAGDIGVRVEQPRVDDKRQE